jgi:hypothetical protein
LIIGDRNGSFSGMLEKRTLQIVWVNKDEPVGVGNAITHPAQMITYEGKAITIEMK